MPKTQWSEPSGARCWPPSSCSSSDSSLRNAFFKAIGWPLRAIPADNGGSLANQPWMPAIPESNWCLAFGLGWVLETQRAAKGLAAAGVRRLWCWPCRGLPRSWPT